MELAKQIIAFFVGLIGLGGVTLVTLGATPALTVQQGGTGTSTVPANYVLMGLNSGRLTAVSTSSLGITAAGDGTFSTTSANYWASLGLAFSTTSADAWVATKSYLTSVDISANTNLAATYPLILTNDTLSTAFGTTTANTFSALNTFSNSTSTLFTATTAWLTNLFIGVDTIAEYIADTAGAFFTGNTETGITVTYQDSDNTVDVVCDTASGSVFGCLATADWTSFNSRLSTTTSQTLAGQGLFHSTTSVTAQLAGSVTIGTLTLTNDLAVAQGGTGASTLTGVVLGNGTSAFTAASAQTCTNQFARAMSAAYVVTCATVQSEDINLGDTFAWTSVHDFGGATSIEMVNGASPTVDAIGEFALDTTSNQLLVATSTNATYPAVFYQEQEKRLILASSTIAYFSSATTTLNYDAPAYAELISAVACYTDTGTTTIRIGDGTNWMPFILCGSGTDTITKSFANSNNSFTAREKHQLEIRNTAGTPNQTTIIINSRVTRD